MAKLLTWALDRRKEVTTGLVLSAVSEPVSIEDSDLWIDTATMKLYARVGGVSEEMGDLT